MALVTVTIKEEAVREWLGALRLVRRELFDLAVDHAKYAKVSEANRLLDAYSALSQLTDVLREGMERKE